MTALRALIATELSEPQSAVITTVARVLMERLQGDAVLFYGSTLRTGDLDGVQDFYVLRASASSSWLGGSRLWPDISYHEIDVARQVVRAKVATMPLDVFRRSAAGVLLDTTIWTRFVQPSALLSARDASVHDRVVDAITLAAVTAATFAALHGPVAARPLDYWRALFKATYETELRVEAPGRHEQIVAHQPARYERLLPLAWRKAGIAFDECDGCVSPRLRQDQIQLIAEAWCARAGFGRWLNAARLVKAAFTFDGAARYALWKIERHTGVRIALTPWRERHPILSAPGVLWRVWRAGAGR